MEREDMTIYDTVDDYLQNFKVGDKVVLAGYGLVDGIKAIQSKYDTYTVTERTTSTRISLKAYRGRSYLTLGPDSYDQRVAVISAEAFKKLD